MWSHGPAEAGQSRRGNFTATTVSTCKQLSTQELITTGTKCPEACVDVAGRTGQELGTRISPPRLLSLTPSLSNADSGV